MPVLQTRRLVAQSLLAEGITSRRSLMAQQELNRISAQQPVDAYFRALEKERGEPNALEAKLFRAGFHKPSAPIIYTICRLGAVGIGFLSSYALLSNLLPPQL